jgi:imidazole glycerol-phosphate synthase subunit HisH
LITIVDYGLGNLGSIVNMFKRVGVQAAIVSDLDKISSADKILLPGVGKFDAAMTRLNETGLREVLDQKVLIDKIPVLGICLGMQLMTNNSDEGELAGLGWVDAETKKFPKVEGLKVPHMGWNLVKPCKSNPLCNSLPGEPRFYFVHSYYVEVSNQAHSLMKTSYEVEFDSAICRENIYGMQFHPEKSHKFGMAIFKQFAEL